MPAPLHAHAIASRRVHDQSPARTRRQRIVPLRQRTHEQHGAAGQAFRGVAWLVAAGTVLALFLHWLPVLPQRNVHWIALMLPMLKRRLGGRRGA